MNFSFYFLFCLQISRRILIVIAIHSTALHFLEIVYRLILHSLGPPSAAIQRSPPHRCVS
jgi:hypothetical protein